MNELETDICPTDCRYRPDQRLMEDGLWDEANIVKKLLEEAQRERRRRLESLAKQALEQGKEPESYRAMWFSKISETDGQSFMHDLTKKAVSERARIERDLGFGKDGEKHAVVEDHIYAHFYSKKYLDFSNLIFFQKFVNVSNYFETKECSKWQDKQLLDIYNIRLDQHKKIKVQLDQLMNRLRSNAIDIRALITS